MVVYTPEILISAAETLRDEMSEKAQSVVDFIVSENGRDMLEGGNNFIKKITYSFWYTVIDSFQTKYQKIMDYFPLFLNLKAQNYLVIGAGEIAARKIELLARSGAVITVAFT